MATLLLSAAGSAIGSGFGGSILGLSGAIVGRAVGATIGRSIDQRIIGSGSEAVEVGRIERFRISGVGYGVPIKQIWGRTRVAGEVIWASRFAQSVRKSGGGKGSPRPTVETFSYSVSLAISLCLGEATAVGRIWADGVEISKNKLNLRFYPGSETQLSDPKIEAVEGVGLAPSYRGICYVVIEDLQLSTYGNRIPQFSFEVIRPAKVDGDDVDFNLQKSIQAVALIPGSGEYALATTPVSFGIGIGRSQSANVHSIQEMTDFQLSLNQLDDELPNCQSVSLVVSWFGNDLRAGSCIIQPKVEQSLIDGTEMPWVVSGVGRTAASVVPSQSGRPIYGGTPSDQSVIEAIRAIRAKGKEVMFYPFILMDQLEGNGLPDPWSDNVNQPALPWRGRITLSNAPGRPESPDQTALASTEISQFLGAAQPSDFSTSGVTINYLNPNLWGYRRFILHYAHLCVLAGGVDAFCIGSEMRGLTQARSAEDAFPMVDALCVLAAEVKDILGSDTAVSYAADWTEYSGYHTGDDVYFNLDKLWASESVDFVGIDNYMPISDWRDGEDHADATWGSIYNPEYLMANIAGGEGYDWYYDSPEGEAHQLRKPIVDGNYGEHWVFRYKDIKGWWSNTHYDRTGGLKLLTSTGWEPGMKPIRFTEYGCAALDKATNQPNKFLDPKSSESLLPRGSNATRDDLIQMQYLNAMARYWSIAENNPQASLYSGSMLDLSRSHVWAWDARPFPEFPGNVEVWSDHANYDKGHWLNGRSSGEQVGAAISEICQGLTAISSFDVSMAFGALQGQMVYSDESARAKLQSLCVIYSIDVAEIDGVLFFFNRKVSPTFSLDTDRVCELEDGKTSFSQTRLSNFSKTERIRLSFIRAENDFEVRSVEAAFPDSDSQLSSDSEFNVVLRDPEARRITDRWLVEATTAQESFQFDLPRSFLKLNAGDVITVAGLTYRIESIEERGSLHVEGTRTEIGTKSAGESRGESVVRSSPLVSSGVFAQFLDLPILTGAEVPHAPHVAVASEPWRGPVAVWSSASESGYTFNARIDSPTILGTLASELRWAPTGLWDRSSKVNVVMVSGQLSSVSSADVLNGSNVVAIGSGNSDNWEICQFADAVLIGPGQYQISMLLRGLAGSDALNPGSWPIGSLFVVIDASVPQIDLSAVALGLDRYYRIGLLEDGFSSLGAQSRQIAFDGVGLRPYSVSHLKCELLGDGAFYVHWVRRTRINGDSWSSIEVPLGEELESYVVRIVVGTIVVREVTVGTSNWTYTTSTQTTDGISGGFSICVAQASMSFGVGPFVSVDV